MKGLCAFCASVVHPAPNVNKQTGNEIDVHVHWCYNDSVKRPDGPMAQASDFTIDELICVCVSRQLTDGEIVVQGISTPLVVAGILLAKHTHAPNLQFASAIANALARDPAPLGLTRIEDLWLDRTLIRLSFAQTVCEFLPRYAFTEFFRPAQIDRYGNFNNVAIGEDYHRPRFRLPGCGGIGDLTTFSDNIYIYVPRHSRAVFVEQVDFVSGLGHTPERRKGSGPRYLVSDLGQFDFAAGKMRLTTLHPGVTLEKVQRRTGFPLETAPDLHPTLAPTVDEVRLLREVIDPLGIRRLETVSGSERKRLLPEMLAAEKAFFQGETHDPSVPVRTQSGT